jgi:hypothetical protein
MHNLTSQIHDSEIVAQAFKLGVIARSEFSRLHGCKMDGPRNSRERALLDFQTACEELEVRANRLIEELEKK